jgi:hypothetical protein
MLMLFADEQLFIMIHVVQIGKQRPRWIQALASFVWDSQPSGKEMNTAHRPINDSCGSRSRVQINKWKHNALRKVYEMKMRTNTHRFRKSSVYVNEWRH